MLDVKLTARSIPRSVFVQTNGTITSGAYDKLCD